MNLKHLLMLPAAAALAAGCCSSGARSGSLPAEMPFEMPAVVQPAIPARSVSVADFGASGDAHTLATGAFAAAIDALAEQGGGRVVVPAGVWYTGPIVLKDNIELHLEQNSMIVFSDDKSLYPLVQITFEGLNTWRCQSPVSATHAKSIAITGFGVIDGNGDAWRAVKRGKLTAGQWNAKVRSGGIVSEDGNTWYPSESFRFGATSGSDQNVSTWARTREDFEKMKDFLRPVLVAFHHCENVLLEGVTFQNSPCWHIHPAMCTNLTVRNITVRCPDYAQNGDGIDIESCKNVVLTGSRFDVGDDGICIKSGKDKAGRDRGIPCENQRKLVELARTNDLLFATGPAGSGKTYTAIALAVRALRNREVKRIVLSRPAVEAGESLGFLPGDMKEKVDPYLQPLYDALSDMIPPKKLEEYLEAETIQIAPLAYMRGRTLNDSFVILDEAQNTTRNQLKMFLTRMGVSAKFVITGDMSQIDLPRREDSGLTHAFDILKNIPGIAFVTFDSGDIVRHRLVKEIVKAYSEHKQS